jgi:predicted metalloprotease with PDZ domain
MLLRPRLLLALAVAIPARLPAQTDTIRYHLDFMPGGSGTPRVAVDVEFRGERGGRTRIAGPTSWAGEEHLEDAISELTADPGVTIGSDDAGERMLTHRPGAWIHLHYVLRQDWPGPLRYPLFHRVVIDDRRVVFNQSTGLIYPEHAPGAGVVLQYQWSGLPPDWRILTSFGAKARFSGTVSWREFSSAFFSAGEFRLAGSPSTTGGISVETTGRWNFSDAAFGQLVGALWQRESTFWGVLPFDQAFVLLLPIDNSGTIAGTAFTGGFFAVSDTAADLKDLGRLLAHELFHLWNGQRISATVNEARYKWFTEGFTDYYADRMFRDLGRYSTADYRDRVNAELRAYYASPVRGITRADVAVRYWTDDTVKQYPYAQGYAFALYLQNRLPAWSGGAFDLDSLLVAAYHAIGARNYDLTDGMLVNLVPASARDSTAGAIARYIDRGSMIPALPGALGPCHSVGMVQDERGATLVPRYTPIPGGPGCMTLGR